MFKEYWFREFHPGLKVTASLNKEESYTRIIDGQVRCITQEHIQKRGQNTPTPMESGLSGPHFFSVLRLCGSRQVVAQCSADERIIQMHILCPSLGSRKWSADLYAVRSLVRPNNKGNTKTKQNHKPNTHKTQRKSP